MIREITIPIKLEVRARASSHFTVETIDNRLALLRQREQDEETIREIDYLERLRARKYLAAE